jgi:hypothetical protein
MRTISATVFLFSLLATGCLEEDWRSARVQKHGIPHTGQECVDLGGTVRASDGGSDPQCEDDERPIVYLPDYTEGALCCL